MPPSVIGVDVLDGATSPPARAGNLMSVQLVVGAGYSSGAVGSALWAVSVPVALCVGAHGKCDHNTGRESARGNERVVTMAVPSRRKAKGKGQIDPSPLAFDL